MLNTKIKAAGGNDWKSMIVYIVGVTAGISWSNAHLEVNGKPPMFCLPEGFRTNADFDIKILEVRYSEIGAIPTSVTIPVKSSLHCCTDLFTHIRANEGIEVGR